MLKVKNLTKTFNKKIVLDNIDFEINKGEIGIFLGKSGSGKSTLLRVLTNLIQPDTGEFELNNKKLKLETINKKHLIGMIFQNFNLFENMTALQNITFVIEKIQKLPTKDAQKVAHDLLKSYDLNDEAHTYPINLSGGQKQRLAIARSLALSPQIMCFDEPTSALDPKLTNLIAHNIKKLAEKGLIILVATHDITLVEKLTSTIFLIKKGTIVEKAQQEIFFKNKDAFPLIKNFTQGN